jgi:hypothetical protein
VWVVLHFGWELPRICVDLCGAPGRVEMIVIVGDAFGLPPPLLRLCNCIDHMIFRSIRAQMVDLLQPPIAFGASGRALRRLSGVCGLLFAVLRFRAFFEPLGLAEAAVLDETALRRFLARGGGAPELPLRSLRDADSKSSSGRRSPTAGRRPLPRLRDGRARGPRRRIRGHRPGRAYVAPETAPGSPTGSRHRAHLRLPRGRHRRHPPPRRGPLRAWNPLRWVGPPLRALAPADAAAAASRQSRAGARLPSRPPAASPLASFLRTEAAAFNRAAAAVSADLSHAIAGQAPRVRARVPAGQVPRPWREALA